MIDSSEWKEFRIGDIFDVFTGSLLDVKTLKNGKIPRISVTNENNGILDYFDSENSNNARHFENFISVNFFGQCFYHPYKASLEMKVHVLKLKNREFNKNLGLFFSSILNKTLENKFTYSKQLSSSKLKNDDIKIILPTKNNKIDFDFMENFIDKIEQKQRGILEFYKHKKQNGGGYELNSKTWKEFKLSELFDIERGTRFIKSKRKNGKIPLVTAGEQNQGVAEFIAYDDKLKIYENHLTIDMFCNCFYRNYKFLCDDNILVFLPKINISNKSLLFMTSVINKDKAKFGYEKQYRQKSFAKHKIKLPITQNGEIDFDFMESFIKAIQKECIKGVDSYLSKNIATTKELIK